jgi:hypothetical protein
MTAISWVPLLAAIPTDPAERAGYFVGMALGAFLMLAIILFGLFSIIMALVKRTTGWIIAGSISGFLILVVGGLLMVGFIVGVTKGLTRTRLPILAKTPSEIITGKALPFTIEKPPGWTVTRGSGAYDTLISDGTGYVGVIAETLDAGSNDRVADFSRKRFESMGSELTLGKNEPATLDGHNWLAFTASCKVQNLPFSYRNYVYTGKEGTVQVMEWSYQSNWERESSELSKVVQTFHFPAPDTKP